LEKRVLNLGDIIIESENLEEKEEVKQEDNNILLLIERKSLSDLLASIKDGRYEEQSYRLNGSEFHNHNIIYLLEGDIDKVNRFKNNAMDKTIFYSSLFSLNYYKGFSVIKTISIEETAFFMCNTIIKIKKGIDEKKLPFYSNEQLDLNIVSEPYVNVVKKIKKENITPENIGEIMLCQVPGISAVSATAIMKKFSSIKELLEKIVENEKCLEDIYYENTKGQKRKLNKNCIKNLRNFLIPL
jgi:ERCC4-type nuclease